MEALPNGVRMNHDILEPLPNEAWGRMYNVNALFSKTWVDVGVGALPNEAWVDLDEEAKAGVVAPKHVAVARVRR